jgi:hypothetical protein
MNVGRLCSIEGPSSQNTHQRVTGYFKMMCANYPGMGFSSHVEWVGEQVVEALRLLLADTNCTEEERQSVHRFLDLAAQELPGEA